ncbi:cupin domain-containing protein [Phaeovulum sp.]|uniref:cupin domain-containing protein n=1 Tax=Phaeovulum sp. TaxID=2934796 RepID=UPI003564D691
MNLHSAPETIEWQGTRYRTLLPASQTGARLSIFESLDQPGYGPPRHIHKTEDETFYVLAGEVEFWLEGQTTRHGPGEVVFVERGRQHTFRVLGEMPARMVTVMTPGGFDGFFAEMAKGRYRIPEDMAQIAAIGAKYNLEFTGPPLGH